MAAKYEVVDNQTSRVVASYTSRRRAQARADKMDLQYGAVRYVVRPVW